MPILRNIIAIVITVMNTAVYTVLFVTRDRRSDKEVAAIYTSKQ